MATELSSRQQMGPALIPAPLDEPDPRQSLQHVLAAEPSPQAYDPQRSSTPASARARKRDMVWIQEDAKDHKEDEGIIQSDSYSRAADVNPSHTMTVAHTRRNANGTIGSVYSGNKIRHLKKDDGIPLWRKDIQFAFLHAVFDDRNAVFTKASDGSHGHTFAEIYIDAMARSSKTSKILKEKLLSDRSAALSMAMICLLVNVGRMNTTLNFFPEMRAQLRTYHSIPSLQAHQDPNAYKQLQDAPRLKSILKGASEDVNQPTTIEKVRRLPIPRTNPVNLIFVLSQYAPKISETHFFPPRDFFDLVMRGTLSSQSRARAFLWLIWHYLESDFSPQSAGENPFGKGQAANPGDPPFKVPPFEHLTEEQANAENVDTQAEKDYGEMKRLERKRILEEDETVGPPMKKAKKNGLDDHGILPLLEADQNSPSPGHRGFAMSKPTAVEYPGSDMMMTGAVHDISPGAQADTKHTFSDRAEPANIRLVLKSRGDNTTNASTAMPPGANHPTFPSNANGHGYRRSRPQTSHQKAVDINRKMRVEHILHQQLHRVHASIRKRKRRKGTSFVFAAMKRIYELPDGYDTEGERSWGPGGLVPGPGEKEAYGEDALRHKKALDRAIRRLERDDNGASMNGVVREGNPKRKAKQRSGGSDDRQSEPGVGMAGKGEEGYLKQPKSSQIRAEDEAQQHEEGGRGDGLKPEEGLDDLDLDLLGESRDEENGDEDVEDVEDSGLDDTEGEGEGEGSSE
ncbi:MAG: hypothetical protein LQ339_004685 [Xanthoria mediterranea]|nr:MAG: hypothetical protein LQ339_004685 [Xanthoria mediterranea]